MGESNTVSSAYTMYRHLQQYCSHLSICLERVFHWEFACVRGWGGIGECYPKVVKYQLKCGRGSPKSQMNTGCDHLPLCANCLAHRMGKCIDFGLSNVVPSPN